MEGHCSTGQSPQWAVVLMEEEEEGEEEEEEDMTVIKIRTSKDHRISWPALSPHRDPQFTMQNIREWTSKFISY